MAKLDKELEEFRSLMEVPSKFEEGFTFSSLLGALFLALIIVPAALYVELIAGMGVGPAAQWVTVILFLEIARRANTRLSRAQLFVLFFMAGLIVAQNVHGTLLFTQFLVRSEAAVSYGISSLIPDWVAPKNLDELPRSFLQLVWLPALGLLVFRTVFSKLNQTILGYGLFRVVSDVERLPFPMAPVGAMGISALAEEVGSSGDESQPTRWRVFCIGGAIGMGFGLVYMALPILSGAFLNRTLTVFPIPFADWSRYTERALPAVATGFSFDLGQLILGMVMPFFAMLGSFVGLVITYIANPLLHSAGVLHLWQPGDKTVEILFKNGVDLYFSLGIGLSAAIAVLGVAQIFRRRSRAERAAAAPSAARKARGDISTIFMTAVYIVSVSACILLSGWLVHWHLGVMLVLVFYGFLYTPLISYVTARLEGTAGQVVEIPFIQEISFILSGYKGVAIWFIPVPRENFGRQTVLYKQAELLGTRFSSLWKATAFLVPIIIVATILFSSFIWSMGEIPSPVYPYTQEIWDLDAKNACLVYSSTMGEYSPFQDALSGPKVGIGFALGLMTFGGLYFLNAPLLIFYGLIRGVGQTLPHVILPQFLGAMLGRFYFEKKYGKQWRSHVPVLSAGFFVGGGLVAMFCIGVVFLCKATSALPY